MQYKNKVLIAGGISILAIVALFSAFFWLMKPSLGFNNPTSNVSRNPLKISDIVTTSTEPASGNLLSNGSFDEDPFDTDWTTSTPDDQATLTATTTATSSPTAVLCEMLADDSNGCIVQQTVSSTDSGLDYNVSFDARANETATVGTTTLRVLLTDETPTPDGTGNFENFTQCASLNAGVWTIVDATSTVDEATEHCLIQLEVGGGIPLVTSSYFHYDFDELLPAVPSTFASGNVSILFEMFGDTGDQVFLDNVNINEIEYTAFHDVDPTLIEYKGIKAGLRSDSKFCMFDTADGCVLWFSYDDSDSTFQWYTSASSAPATVTSSSF